MALILQITIGVFVGGLLLRVWQKRAERKERELEARRRGEEFGQELSDLVEAQAATTLGGLEAKLMDVMAVRIERLAHPGESKEDEQAINRRELAELMSASEGAESILRDAFHRNHDDYVQAARQLGAEDGIEMLIKHRVNVWRAGLPHVASATILAARERARARYE